MNKGAHLVQTIRHVYSSTNVTTGAWVQLDSALDKRCNHVEIFDSSGETLKLGYGAAGSEVDALHILPGGNERVPCILEEGMRLAVKAVSGTASTGELVINFYV